MLHLDQVEELMQVVHALDREALLEQLQSYDAGFPLDFTPEFLGQQPTERLRHIFMALCLHSQRLPEVATPEAA
jgi:hypothetical protein